MLKITDKDSNYLAKVVELKGLRKHNNADRLQCVDIDFQNVITGLTAKNGDVYVYFPVECAINKEFLAFTNSFRNTELNSDPNEVGFFEPNARVKAMKLRGEQSMGYIVPVETVEQFTGQKISSKVNSFFDTIGEFRMCEKYVPKYSKQQGLGGKVKQGQKPKVSRLVDGQVRLHVNTANLRLNAHQINPNDIISVTYKTHGTSWWSGNLKVKKVIGFWQRILKFFGADVVDTEYDIVYGSRKVVKNKDMDDAKNKEHYYGYDLWKDISDHVKEHTPKGFTLYGECIGFEKNGGAIQKGYDYGCEPRENKIEVYRITQTNEDGFVTELTYPEIKEFCDKTGLNAPFLFYYGKAADMFPEIEIEEHWNENFVEKLQEVYNEKNCFMCKNEVPEEGIVVRKESLLQCESYKLKSFAFLGWESKQLDSGEVDIENAN